MQEELIYYDVAIIGTGIGGSTLATVLARQGLKVIVFEAGTHPRFAIGESMILETSEVMRAMAEYYDVPEMAYYSSENYYGFIGTQHGVKRHFSFLHHFPGRKQEPSQSLQAVIPKLPYGHEIHIYRQDSDALLTAVAISYGATVLQNTLVKDTRILSDGVEIVTNKDKTLSRRLSGGCKWYAFDHGKQARLASSRPQGPHAYHLHAYGGCPLL